MRRALISKPAWRKLAHALQHELAPGLIAYFLVDDVAERYIDLLDAVDDEIDELEEGVDTWPAEKTRKRISEGLVESFSGTCPTCNGRGFVFDESLL